MLKNPGTMRFSGVFLFDRNTIHPGGAAIAVYTLDFLVGIF
jgi:hypothetical protein